MQSGFTVLSAAYNYYNYFWASITFQPFHQIEIVVFWFYYVLDFQLELKNITKYIQYISLYCAKGSLILWPCASKSPAGIRILIMTCNYNIAIYKTLYNL